MTIVGRLKRLTDHRAIRDLKDSKGMAAAS